MIGEGIQSTNQRRHTFVRGRRRGRLLHRPDASASAAKPAKSRARNGTKCPTTASIGAAIPTTTPATSAPPPGGTCSSSSRTRPKGNQIAGPMSLGDASDASEDPFRWVFLSDVCKHCEVAGCLEVVPDRLDRAHRSRLRARAGRRLQRLRLLRGLVPVRRDRSTPRAAAERGRRLQMHLLLRPPKERPHARLRESLPDRIDRLRPARRPARARRAARRSNCTRKATTTRRFTIRRRPRSRGMHAFFLLLGEPEAYGLPPKPRGADDLPESLPGRAALAHRLRRGRARRRSPSHFSHDADEADRFRKAPRHAARRSARERGAVTGRGVDVAGGPIPTSQRRLLRRSRR